MITLRPMDCDSNLIGSSVKEEEKDGESKNGRKESHGCHVLVSGARWWPLDLSYVVLFLCTNVATTRYNLTNTWTCCINEKRNDDASFLGLTALCEGR